MAHANKETRNECLRQCEAQFVAGRIGGVEALRICREHCKAGDRRAA